MNHQQAWLIRPNSQDKDQTQLFLKHNLITVDVPQVGDVSGKSPTEIGVLISKAAPELSKKELTKFTGYIHAIANEMWVGDLVILAPSKDSSPNVHLGKISSDYKTNIMLPMRRDADTSHPFSFNHVHNVEWKREVPRSNLTQDLRNALRVPKSVANLSAHYEEINALIHEQDYVPQQKDIVVSYNLRPDYTIQFTIPPDMTSAEAKRLSEFFKVSYFKE